MVIAAWVFVVCAAIALVRGTERSTWGVHEFILQLWAGIGLSLPRLLRLVLWPVGVTVVLPASGLIAALDILSGQPRARMTAGAASLLGILIYCAELWSAVRRLQTDFLTIAGDWIAAAAYLHCAFDVVVPAVCVCAWLACLILFAANRRWTSQAPALPGAWHGRTVSRARAVMLGLPVAWIVLEKVFREASGLSAPSRATSAGVVETAVLLAFAFVIGRVVFAVERTRMAGEAQPE
jgi:hypothetical protein